MRAKHVLNSGIWLFLIALSSTFCGDGAHAFQSENNESQPVREVTPTIDWDEVRKRLKVRSLERDGSSPRLRLVNLKDAGNVAREEIDKVRFPVLVLNEPRALGNLKLYGQKDAYFSSTMQDETVLIRVSGARKKLVLATPPSAIKRLAVKRGDRPPLPRLGGHYLITRSMSSTDLSFSLFGAGYVVSVICDDPQNDERCSQDDYVKQLGASLGLLNRPPKPSAPPLKK